MATKKESKKKTSSRKRKGASRRSGGLFGLGLGKVANTFSLNKLMDIAKLGGLALVGYIGANMAGRAVSKLVNKDEQNPQGIKKYANALAQGAVTAVCLRMGKKYAWVRMATIGAALSTTQVTVETATGKSVLDMFKFGSKTATNGVEGLGDGSTDLILPRLEGGEDDYPTDGVDDDDINGADDFEGIEDDDINGADDFEGIEDDDISGADDFEGVDDDDEGISGDDDDFDGFDDDDEGISGDDIIE